jgi:inosine-uridine nucleoside N-ribohydrolase
MMEPVYIFDTDMGNDVDDLLAQILLIGWLTEARGSWGAAVVNKGNRLAPAFVDLVNRYYDCRGVPIGWSSQGPAPEEAAVGEYAFLRPVLERLGPDYLDYVPDCKDWPDAVAVLRKTLAEASNHSVVYISIGFTTVLAALLESPADSYSPLTGRELVQSKVRFVSMMGGEFGHLEHGGEPHPEHNIVGDIESAQSVMTLLPVPIFFSGFEVGERFLFPGCRIEAVFAEDPDHPLRLSYALYKGFEHDRPLWDLTAVLFAIAPEAGYFDFSEPGEVRVGPDGVTHFRACEAGKHRYLKIREETMDEIMRIFIEHCLYSKPSVVLSRQPLELCVK